MVVTRTIRELRMERGWSQNDLAVKLGVTPVTVYNWERGKYEPSASTFKAIGLAFGVPMESVELVSMGDEQGKPLVAA